MEGQGKKNNRRSTQQAATGIRKVPTQIHGLDDILYGGFPAGRTTLLSGAPGTGKTVLALEFLYRGAVSGNPGIFLTFEETVEALRENALTLGYDLAYLEEQGALSLLGVQVDPDVLLSGDFNLKALFAIIGGKVKTIGADRIVIDGIDILMRLFRGSRRQQSEIFAMHKCLRDQRLTTILTAKNIKGQDSSQYSFLDFMADCVIYLDHRVKEQVSTKRLQVIKYRGSGYVSNECPFVIMTDGIYLLPVTQITMSYRLKPQRISSGNPSLDAFLGGGYQAGTCILISGPAGSGKTSVACTFACAACKEGHKVLYVNYEESQEGMLIGMLSIGIDLRPAIEDSAFQVVSIMPESMGTEEHLFHLMMTIKRFEPEHLVIDAVSACERIGGKLAAFDFVVRIIDACKTKGITVLLINQLSNATQEHDVSGMGISSIIDTIIKLDYKFTDSEMIRNLLVMKSRGTRHSHKFHSFVLTDQGIRIDAAAI